MQAHELTPEWLSGDDGMREPFWVEKPEGLGMTMPHGEMTIGEVAQTVGELTVLLLVGCVES